MQSLSWSMSCRNQTVSIYLGHQNYKCTAVSLLRNTYHHASLLTSNIQHWRKPISSNPTSSMVQAMQFRGSASGKVVRTTAELPDAGPDEVLVKVTDSGLCGSDLHSLRVLLVLGHEGGYSIDVKVFADHSTGIGIVEEFGSACSQLKVGDRDGWGLLNSTCASCDMCITGRDPYCPNAKTYGAEGYDTHDSICSHTVCKEQWLFKIPDIMSSVDAAPLMCRSCAKAHTWWKQSRSDIVCKVGVALYGYHWSSSASPMNVLALLESAV